ncbi:hypothetical protein [Haloechinothrix salitolerans]|uniref:hypothetical protein n=1 Tax=Haloechinothrix salitolerans TaxID=926830 RepID=UPI0035EC984B
MRRLLHGLVLGPHDQYLGYVFDVAVQQRHGQYPLVAGLLAGIGVREVFLPSAVVRTWHPETITLDTAPKLRPFRDHDHLTLVASELLGHVFTDTTTSTDVSATDFLLHRLPFGWALTTIDTGPTPAQQSRRSPTNRLIDWKSAQQSDGP